MKRSYRSIAVLVAVVIVPLLVVVLPAVVTSLLPDGLLQLDAVEHDPPHVRGLVTPHDEQQDIQSGATTFALALPILFEQEVPVVAEEEEVAEVMRDTAAARRRERQRRPNRRRHARRIAKGRAFAKKAPRTTILQRPVYDDCDAAAPTPANKWESKGKGGKESPKSKKSVKAKDSSKDKDSKVPKTSLPKSAKSESFESSHKDPKRHCTPRPTLLLPPPTPLLPPSTLSGAPVAPSTITTSPTVPSVITTHRPTDSPASASPVAPSASVQPTTHGSISDDFEPFGACDGVVTTPFDPYEKDDCYWQDNVLPHPINQCECKNEIAIVANDTMELYWKVRQYVNDEIYSGLYKEDTKSCAPSNIALLWLSSGDMCQGGDLYQRYLLALTYVTLNGTMWDRNNWWLSEDNECLWYGIHCQENFLLDSMKLDMNNIFGSLPTELRHLDGLKELSMTRNYLSGTIPTEIFDLPRLEVLVLSENQLHGSIPADVQRASQLRTLRLENNLLFGRLVPEVGELNNLEEFSVGFNEFWRPIPTDIAKLTKMRWLVLEDNRFSGTLHTELALMTDLEYFLMSNNLLTGTIPTEFAALTKLQEFRLSTAGLGGTLPTALGSLTSLHRLEMGFNNFKGTLDTEIGLLTGLSWLAVNNNDFSGPIPTEMGNLVNMTNLLMNNCLFTGDLPTEFGRMTQLSSLMLDYNDLTGTAPEEVCALRNRMLDVFVVDCPNTGMGFVCPESCCTLCRQSDVLSTPSGPTAKRATPSMPPTSLPLPTPP